MFVHPRDRNHLVLDRFGEQVALHTVEVQALQLEIECKKRLLTELDSQITSSKQRLATVQFNLRSFSDQVNSAIFKLQELQRNEYALNEEIDLRISHLRFLDERYQRGDSKQWAINYNFGTHGYTQLHKPR